MSFVEGIDETRVHYSHSVISLIFTQTAESTRDIKLCASALSPAFKSIWLCTGNQALIVQRPVLWWPRVFAATPTQDRAGNFGDNDHQRRFILHMTIVQEY